MNGLTRELMAIRIVQELTDGTYVNLGIGIPTLVSQWLPKDMDKEIIFQSEKNIMKIFQRLGVGFLSKKISQSMFITNMQ